jgi:hypothetical protein
VPTADNLKDVSVAVQFQAIKIELFRPYLKIAYALRASKKPIKGVIVVQKTYSYPIGKKRAANKMQHT